jgi:hypothetical protein
MSLKEDGRLRRFLETVCRHPWARFEFLLAESGLTEFEARRTRQRAIEAGYVETMRIATKGQPRPPRRYAMTSAGARQFGFGLPRVNRRGGAHRCAASGEGKKDLSERAGGPREIGVVD